MAGLDVSNAILAEVTAILSEADGSIGQIPQNHFYILEALRVDGSEEQKRFFFGRALAGDRFGNALSERGTKTVADYNTRITPEGPGYRVNGQKFYSTGVLFADWITVFALDPEERLTMSFLAKGTEGIEIVDDWDGFGQRTTGSGTTIFNDVYVNADAIVFHHKGFERADHDRFGRPDHPCRRRSRHRAGSLRRYPGLRAHPRAAPGRIPASNAPRTTP